MSTAQPQPPPFRFLPRVPQVVQRLFDAVPLLTYPANGLPARSPPAGDELPSLYVFIHPEDALKGRPSFNPQCLKWQTFLKIARVRFRVVPSTNHASPSGALPFLLPPRAAAENNDAPPPRPLSADKLAQYALDHGASGHDLDSASQHPVYQSLIDSLVRRAWLQALYLTPANMPLVRSLYLAPASSSAAVQAALLHQLRRAASAEVRGGGAIGGAGGHAASVYAGAQDAFQALSASLGDGPWFFGGSHPSLFDAAIFSYTHLLLDPSMGWVDRTLADMVGQFANLVAHRRRILDIFWSDESHDGWAAADSASWEKI